MYGRNQSLFRKTSWFVPKNCGRLSDHVIDLSRGLSLSLFLFSVCCFEGGFTAESNGIASDYGVKGLSLSLSVSVSVSHFASKSNCNPVASSAATSAASAFSSTA